MYRHNRRCCAGWEWEWSSACADHHWTISNISADHFVDDHFADEADSAQAGLTANVVVLDPDGCARGCARAQPVKQLVEEGIGMLQ